VGQALLQRIEPVLERTVLGTAAPADACLALHNEIGGASSLLYERLFDDLAALLWDLLAQVRTRVQRESAVTFLSLGNARASG
jgi:hypothetical protein